MNRVQSNIAKCSHVENTAYSKKPKIWGLGIFDGLHKHEKFVSLFEQVLFDSGHI